MEKLRKGRFVLLLVMGNALLPQNSMADGFSWELFLPAILSAGQVKKELQWQLRDDGKYYTWEQAKSYCQNLTLEGHSDWRLPSKEELKTLITCSNGHPLPRDWQTFGGTYEGEIREATCCIDYPACQDYDVPTIVPGLYTNTHYLTYWSSTPWTSTPSCSVCAYTVDFAFGLTNGWVHKDSDAFARCVRDVILRK